MDKANGNEKAGASNGDAKNRKLYLARLKEQGLPLGITPQPGENPTQLQVAQLAAVLGASAESKGASELALRAVELWNAAGNALRVAEQVKVLTDGILYYDREDWRGHAGVLVSLMDDSRPLPELNEREEFTKKGMAFRRASERVIDAWYRKAVSPATVLKALFPARSETESSRERKFFELVNNAKLILDERAKWAAYEGKSDVVALRDLIREAWTPLQLPPEAKEGGEDIERVRENLDQPGNFLKTFGFYFTPFVARWLVELRFDQVAASKNRAGPATDEI